MKQNVLFLFSFLLFNTSIAQVVKDYEFIGTLQLSNKTLITYKLNFKELSDGIIEGSSLTDIYGEDRTKSNIKGKYTSGSKRISFYETRNLSTKSKSAGSDFCYVHVSNALIKTVSGKTIIQGKFTGKYSNNEKCAEGYIYLVSSSYLNRLSEHYLNPDIIKNKDTLKLIKEKYNELTDKSEKNVLKTNEVLNINWYSKEIILEVWDGQNEDKDEISILINDRQVLDRFIIKQQKKTIVVPFTGEVNKIEIVAIGEGTYAPCTANIILRDGTQNTPIVAVLKRGESTIVKLNKTR